MLSEEEEYNMMNDYANMCMEEAKEISSHNNRVWKAIEKVLGDEYLKDVLECLEESEANGKIELVRNPGENRQEEDWGSFEHILVDQYCNGGYVGDDFAGYVFIPLRKDLYLKSHYSM